MLLSKFLVLVLCQLSAYYAIFHCDFSNRCHPYGSSWWEVHADICFRCSTGKKYHCARDYDSPDVFKEGCAVEVNCSAGKEPHLRFKESGKAVIEPVVYCVTCYDPDYYNSKTRPSSEYSECPEKKWNDCSKEKHKILCKPDDSTDERFCRCDVRNGYSPVNDLSNEKCSFKDYDCRDYKKCPEPQQLLLNYTCAKRCDEGFDRLDETSDVCLPIPKSTTTRKPAISSTKLEVTSTTEAPTKAPVSISTQNLECDEECDEYSICNNGTCVCQELCPTEDEPDPGGSNTDTMLNVIGGVLGFIIVFGIIIICFKTCRGRKCRDRFCPWPGNPETFYVVIKFTSLQFTEEIRAAGQNIGRLAITQQLETALRNLLSSLPGDIRVRIVGFQSGSLIVRIFIETDGESTKEEIVELFRDILHRGNFSGYKVSSDVFEFRRRGSFEIIVPPPAHLEYIVVPPPTPPETVDNSVVDGRQPYGRHTDRQLSTLSAPLSEPEDVSTPNLSSGDRKPSQPIISSQPIIVHKTTHIYHGPVIKSKGGNTLIALGGDSPKSKNKNVKIMYNKQDVKEGEDQLLLEDEVTETEFIREDSKSISRLEDSNQQNVPVESHTVDELNRTADITCKQHSPTEDCKGYSGVNTGTGNDGATGANPTSELTNVEADSEGKLRTKTLSEKQTLGKSKSTRFCRTTSVSQDSLLSPPNIQDVESLFKDRDEYKILINKVIDKCWKYLLENMDPKLMLDAFQEKEIFEYTFRRDISDKNIRTEKSRMMVSKIRETGEQYYSKFKVCLRDTKQYSCLAKVENVQSDVLAMMGICATEQVPKRSRHNSASHGSLPDLCSISDNEILESEFFETKNDNSDVIYKRASGDIQEEETFVGLESIGSVFQELEKNPTGNTPMVPTDDMQAPPKGKRRPTYVPPVEETVEEDAGCSAHYSSTQWEIESSSTSFTAEPEKPPLKQGLGNYSPNIHLHTLCKEFGIHSKEVQTKCKQICDSLKEVSENILEVWPAYKENHEHTIIFVIITQSAVTSPKDINITEDFEVILRTEKETNTENRTVINHEVDTETRIDIPQIEKLQKIINDNFESLSEKHSNITMISASPFKSTGFINETHKMKREDCIVLYVHIKGMIPIDETYFPKTLGGFPVDVREASLQLYVGGQPSDRHEDVKMGCAIGTAERKRTGTLGGFIEHAEHGLCAITCAHVLLNAADPKSDQLNDIVCLQPSQEYSNSEPCGKLVFYTIGNNSKGQGIDAALIKLEKRRHAVCGDFPDISKESLETAGFDGDQILKYTSGEVYTSDEITKYRDSRLIKYGASSRLKRGVFGFKGCRIANNPMFYRYGLIINNLIQINHISKCGEFSEPGDSGSLVFSVSERGLVALGLLICGWDGSTFAAPICDVLQAIGFSSPYALKSFPETCNISHNEKTIKTRNRVNERRFSMSQDSFFLEPDVADFESELKEGDDYRNFINTVLDKCSQQLLDDMDPTMKGVDVPECCRNNNVTRIYRQNRRSNNHEHIGNISRTSFGNITHDDVFDQQSSININQQMNPNTVTQAADANVNKQDTKGSRSSAITQETPPRVKENNLPGNDETIRKDVLKVPSRSRSTTKSHTVNSNTKTQNKSSNKITSPKKSQNRSQTLSAVRKPRSKSASINRRGENRTDNTEVKVTMDAS